ncbi:MAG: ABC transporter permease subunit [Pseudomonadota bacterium]
MSPVQQLWARFLEHRAAVFALGLLGLIVLALFIGPALSPHAVDSIDFDGEWATAPSVVNAHWFGTDSLGRDVFVRALSGGRISLLVAFAATFVSLLIGVSYGAIAGYFGGALDEWMMRAVDILYALPFLFLVILLMVLFGRNVVLVFVAIGAINWLDMARVVRGQVLALKQREFVLAAHTHGMGSAAILRQHIVPNLMGVVLVTVTLTIPQVILTESFLSFLGLGVQEPATSWGTLINEGAREMQQTPWALLFPAGLMALTLLCFNLVGDALRDVLDPRDSP